MANSSLVAVLFLSLLLFSVNAASTNDDVVSTICPKTRNPPFCSSVLKSAGSTDLKGLATYTLNLARSNAAQSLNLAKSLAAKATDPQLKQRYSDCSDEYDGAVGDIQDAQNYLASGDFNGVNVKASAVMTEIDDCQSNFKQPPADTSVLPKNAKTLDDICSIILVISNLLLTHM